MTINSRKQLNRLRPLAAREMAVLVADLGAYVERAEAVAAGQASYADAEAKAEAFLAHLDAVANRKDVMEKLVREGY